ncbi:MAG: lactate racemase domain-containing protein [Candidatus Caldatribacteriota bacterium]|nr:lactate racemase domain-containing protein [Candidatus Caldatribacteriota bacterium]
MLSIENLKGELTEEQLEEIVKESLKDFKSVKKVLLIHPDYTRTDFTDKLIPLIYQELKNKGMSQIDSLNAGGTHRSMTEEEIRSKLGLPSQINFDNYYNHEYNDPQQLMTVGEIPASFVAEKTQGELSQSIPVVVNKLITEDYDLIITLSGTVPHEAAGYAGGLKVFFPGISGPGVIDFFHWAAVIVGIPKIIGSINNSAREVINKGSSYVFNKIKVPALSFNMVFEETGHRVIPKGLYVGGGFDGFIKAYKQAAKASSQLHIVYIDKPLECAVQVIDKSYDEIWTAGKGSYKLQSPGVMASGGEIIIYAPHINCFHSRPEMDLALRQIGYHCKDYVKKYLESNPEFSKNIAAHVINVRGAGSFDVNSGKEEFNFKVTLATGISKDICESVGLGYRNPDSIRKEDFISPRKLWIENGGKYLLKRKTED